MGVGASALTVSVGHSPAGAVTFTYDTGGEIYWDGNIVFLTDFELASVTLGANARFNYIMSKGEAADFALGVGVGFLLPDIEAGGFLIPFDVGGKIRAFLTPDVSLNFVLGFGGVLDPEILDGWLILGSGLIGSAGVTYYF
ncbi:MAG: hypothetical protein A2289_03690 [Deltaproteobacteria bacterium RIFOXYA12_FULL_58_15]|nr:MAG: hypothetical protein A2289_03690 [Deltaproteobacteria bacterium RIFOXYA12_FULL_58_15]OGR08490.1 MAG: hypothetical protein A2341_02955 [Deltaproteobacteria bacterium RIFOXYB12_FULL_58_9]